MSRIAETFDALAGDRAALVGYLMAGDPTPEESVDHLTALAEAVDVLEIGIPFSDPIADGPVIQAAATRALGAGTTPRRAFEIAERVHDAVPDTPLLFMTYFNLLHRRGVSEFLETAKSVGVDGVIVPDVPLEEAEHLAPKAEAAGVDAVFLASPATDDARMRAIAEATRGFLYLVSTYGITGADVDFEADVVPLVERAKKACQGAGAGGGPDGGDVPLCVGFGVKTADDAAMLAGAGADGVVVGSAFVRRIGEGAEPAEIAELARGIGGGLSG